MSGSVSPPPRNGWIRQATSAFILGGTSLLCRAFLYGLNDVKVVGLDKFLALLDTRRDIDSRQKGLVTLSNHISVMDDPMIWGVLPLRYAWDHTNVRWSLGAHDICYKNSFAGNFFFLGQTMPTHRLRHSPLGGLFQPTMTQAIRLLSAPPPLSGSVDKAPLIPQDAWPIPDTTSPGLLQLSRGTSVASRYYFSADGNDRWLAPSSVPTNRFSWVHIFPEGSVHQQKDRGLRYFKWGVARLILESEPAPDVVPMFIDGLDRVMADDRKFPRFIPRAGQAVRIVFGDVLDPSTFSDLRERWRQLVHKSAAAKDTASTDLQDGKEAREIRIEVAKRMRNEVLKLRRQQGFPEEDPSHGLAETWAVDPHKDRYRSKVDDSLNNQE